ncbi:MAG TPA: site-specific DNA-methyltransferase, partial [Candidatus Moranbacteria bacterium]|nr:site-specific DNA-methyltransferase [Candidatus Moranbacteria bacterium]
MIKLINGDCLKELKKMEDNSIDTLITDPPYGLSKHSEKIIRKTMSEWISGNDNFIPDTKGFMSEKWDSFVPPPAIWKEVYRVLKPGATALVFAGSRTQDLMAMSLRLAGFELFDTIIWVYAQGFPKSLNIGKAIQKHKGVKPIGKKPAYGAIANRELIEERGWNNMNNALIMPKMEGDAQKWEGYGTALKPSYEPIICARKPNDGTYAENALKWEVAGLNVDGGRIDYNGEKPNIGGRANHGRGDGYGFKPLKEKIKPNTQGRFPANIILECICDEVKTEPTKTKEPEEVKGGIWSKSQGKPAGRTYKGGNVKHTNPECPCYILDNQSGKRKGWSGQNHNNFNPYGGNALQKSRTKRNGYYEGYNDKGGASRFFKNIPLDSRMIYTPKASKKERNMGCDKIDNKLTNVFGDFKGTPEHAPKENIINKNHHPTLKPLKLMEYLCTLTKTPTGGKVLDPFMGSGTTGIACKNTGRDFI